MNGTLRPLALLVALGTGLPGAGHAQDSVGGGAPRAWIGILTQTASPSQHGNPGNPVALLVTNVFVNGPAYRGGVLPGDVVVAVNGSPLAAYDTWLNLMAGLEPGEPMQVGLLRQGNEMEVTIIADRRPVMFGSRFDLARLDTIQARVSKTFDSIMQMFGEQPGDSAMLEFTSTGDRLLQWEARVQVSWQQTAAHDAAEPEVALQRTTDRAESAESVEARRANLGLAREEAELRALADQGTDPPAAGGGGELRLSVETLSASGAPSLTPFLLERPVVLGGAQVLPLTSELGRAFGVEAGVLVTDVLHQSAAARAGFLAGDVIVAVAGGTVASLAELRGALAMTELPTVITVVRRGGVVELTYPARQAIRGPIGTD